MLHRSDLQISRYDLETYLRWMLPSIVAVYSSRCWQDSAMRQQPASRAVCIRWAIVWMSEILTIEEDWKVAVVPKLSAAWSTFPWQHKLHRGVFPLQAGKALLLFQWHTKWVRWGRADSSLLLLLQLWVCAQTQTEQWHNRKQDRSGGRQVSSKGERQTQEITTFLWQFNLYAEPISAAEQHNLRSDGSDACCFPKKPPAAANHHSVFLETKKWACWDMQRLGCKN